MYRRALLTLILVTVAATSTSPVLTARAQTTGGAAQEAADQTSGSITGRVINESGQPMADAIVYVVAANRRQGARTARTDEEGKFRVHDIARGVYSVWTQVHGYIMTVDLRRPTYCRPGESVTLVVKKGGVITGTVTDSAGEPVIGVNVTAILKRDPEGRPAPGQILGTSRYTDDRGVYRLFSLLPGVYLVVASSKTGGTSPISAFAEDLPTYYPSSTRDTAAEIEVSAGSEATGIDIRYRHQRGYAISGSITGGAINGSRPVGFTVTLTQAAGGAIESQTFAQPRGNDSPFGFDGIGDGEYLIFAQRYPSPSDDGARSRPIRLRVKGQDITGVDLSLVSLSSVAGRAVLEAGTKDNNIKCDRKREPSIAETLFSLRRIQKGGPKEQPLPSSATSSIGVPDDKGEFRFQGVEPGQYQIETTMLDETWFVRAISMPRAGGATSIDVGGSGIAVKPAERVAGLMVSVAEGAASIRGRVVADPKSSLPERLLVHLVPAEPGAADDTLRFAEAPVQGDGSFTLNNLAPGRYSLVARQASEEEAGEPFPHRLAWNPNSRASLRRESEATNNIVDLKPCQRVPDYSLRYGLKEPTKETPKAKRP